MLVLRWNEGDYLVLQSGRTRRIITRDCVPLDGSGVTVEMRRPRKGGTHAVHVFLQVKYRRQGTVCLIMVGSDSSVKVQHSTMIGTDAGSSWKGRR